MKKNTELTKIFNLKLEKREKLIIGLTLITCLYAIFKFLILKQQKEIEEAKNQISTIKSKELENHKTLTELQSKSTLFSKTLKNNNIMFDLEDKSNNMSRMLKSIVDGDSKEIYNLKKIKLDKSILVNKIRSSYFKIELKSSFLGLSKFLDKLEKQSPWMEIESVKLDRVEHDLRECDGTIKIVTYEIVGEEA